MDLAYLRAHPQQLPTFLKHQRVRETPVSGGSICTASRLTFDTGESVFTKSFANPPDGFFAAQAHGLRWLREAGAVPVPEVIAELPDLLALEWIQPGAPSPRAAEPFGRDPAAHGRHRETDLALLGLWGGVRHLDRILAAYREEYPLAEGWRERVPLHQLYLLLVHTALFGGAYRESVMSATMRFV